MFQKRKYIKSGKFSKKWNSVSDAPVPNTRKRVSAIEAAVDHKLQNHDEENYSDDNWSRKSSEKRTMFQKRKYIKSGKFSKKWNSVSDAPVPNTRKRVSAIEAAVDHKLQNHDEENYSDECWSCKKCQSQLT
jgi:hypothetical protein